MGPCFFDCFGDLKAEIKIHGHVTTPCSTSQAPKGISSNSEGRLQGAPSSGSPWLGLGSASGQVCQRPGLGVLLKERRLQIGDAPCSSPECLCGSRDEHLASEKSGALPGRGCGVPRLEGPKGGWVHGVRQILGTRGKGPQH